LVLSGSVFELTQWIIIAGIKWADTLSLACKWGVAQGGTISRYAWRHALCMHALCMHIELQCAYNNYISYKDRINLILYIYNLKI
jgi:hypothetical protein